MPSESTENYLKAVYSLEEKQQKVITTSELSAYLGINPASVSEMIKKLHKSGLLYYRKSHGVRLSEEGKKIALKIIRKHRLWETFLVEKLSYNWDQVHDLAEQLEHIQSSDLIDRIETYLDYPVTDPHGDIIPDRDGNLVNIVLRPVSELSPGTSGKISGVSIQEPEFLQFLEEQKLTIGRKITSVKINSFDRSQVVNLDNGAEVFISKIVADHLLVTILES